MTANKPLAGFVCSLTVLLILFAPIFYSDYAFLDEAYQLWHNKDGSNYNVFFGQGRWLLAIMSNKLMQEIPSISALKIVRLLSLLSWALFLAAFFHLGKKWQRLIGFNEWLLPLAGVYIACSLSVAVYIGWGACFEAGLAGIFGLWTGHLLFAPLLGNKQPLPISPVRVLLIILMGFCSLFMYQIVFAVMLLPLAFYLIEKKSAFSFRITAFGTGAYLIITILYYGLFLFTLKQGSVAASDRAGISMDILGKLGFFFSAPLSQAFSLNLLMNLHSIISQAFPILMIAGWLLAYLVADNSTTAKKNAGAKKWAFIFLFIMFCMLVYLPVLAAKENFASYRTMFVLNLVVTCLILDTTLRLTKSKQSENMLAIVILFFLVGIGFRNVRLNFIDPLKEEYRVVNNYFNTGYHPGIRVIYFLRPAENMFYRRYGINPFKDEFGVPSTFKDWTPEPLMKQLILEKTNDRLLAEKTMVIQFTDRTAFEAEENTRRPEALYVDVESLFGLPERN
jgi:hypothetical protein